MARMREIGGRKEVRFGWPSPSGRFGRGFFSSINDTVSMTGLGLAVSAGLTLSAGFGAGSSRALLATAACDFRAASVSDLGLVGGWAALVFAFAGASALTLFVSLRFDSAAAALTGLRAGAVLRAAVLVVVFVGISQKFTHGRLVRREPFYCAAGVS